MKTVTITLNYKKQLKQFLRSDYTFKEFADKIEEGRKNSCQLVFETENGGFVLPFSIWSNCIIELS